MKKLLIIILVMSSIVFAESSISLRGVTVGQPYTGNITLSEHSKGEIEKMKNYEQKDGLWYYKKNYKYSVPEGNVPNTIYYSSADGNIKFEVSMKTRIVTRLSIKYPGEVGYKEDLKYLLTNYKLTKEADSYVYNGEIMINPIKLTSDGLDNYIIIYKIPDGYPFIAE